MLRSPVCEPVRFFEHWVNGDGLRLAELAVGRMPAAAPVASRMPAAPPLPETEIRLEAFDGVGCTLPALDPQALRPIKHVLLHGSIASHDACDFSDVDIAVFVDDTGAYAAQCYKAAVCELRRLLEAVLEFDPLMHHGLMFAPASSLCAYDQRFLPLDTLAKSRTLYGPAALRVRPVPASLAERRRKLRECVRSFHAHLRSEDFLANDYCFKNFLSGVLLLPARALAARGTYVYKRESFALAREFFSRQEWEFIARCEALRALWKRPQPSLAEHLVFGRMHPHVRHVIGSRMAPRLNVRRISSAMLDGLLRSAERFLESPELAA